MTAGPIEVPVAPDDDVEGFELDALTQQMRNAGGRAWQSPWVSAALAQLVMVTGDRERAVAYLEHLASKNIYLRGWVARGCDSGTLRRRIDRALGPPPRRATVAGPVSLDDLILAGLTAVSIQERLWVANKAQECGLNHRPIVCEPCDRIFTFQVWVLSHLTKATALAPSGVEEHLYRLAELDAGLDDITTHGLTSARPASDDDVLAFKSAGRHLNALPAVGGRL